MNWEFGGIERDMLYISEIVSSVLSLIHTVLLKNIYLMINLNHSRLFDVGGNKIVYNKNHWVAYFLFASGYSANASHRSSLERENKSE